MIGPIAAIGSAYANILNFSGRASRAEYWWFALFQILVMFGFGFAMVSYLVPLGPEAMEALLTRYTGVFTLVHFLFFWLPSWTLLFRRLHDIDRSAWWQLIVLVPLIGAIVIFVFTVWPGTQGRNRFGPDPYGRGGKSRASVRLPRGMKPAPSEAERRAEILDYYRKNVARGEGQPT